MLPEGRALAIEPLPHTAPPAPAPPSAPCRNNEPGVLQKGMTLTIEPMFSMGSTRERYWADGWTAVTTDGSLSAQWEHTLLITEGGVEVLTAWEGGVGGKK